MLTENRVKRGKGRDTGHRYSNNRRKTLSSLQQGLHLPIYPLSEALCHTPNNPSTWTVQTGENQESKACLGFIQNSGLASLHEKSVSKGKEHQLVFLN